MSQYYKQVISIVNDYLGPASERFVKRQIEFHLNKQNPEDLTKEEVLKLAESTSTALSLLTKDKQSVKDVSTRISKLVANS